MFFGWWLIPIIFGVAFWLYRGRKRYQQKQKAVTELFQKIEDKFHFALNGYLLGKESKQNFATLQTIIEEAFLLIKPEIDAIFGIISQSILFGFQVPFETHTFQPAIIKVESLCQKIITTKKELNNQDLLELYTTFKDCIRAKILEIKIQWSLE